jgi:hypothetical protein
VENDGNTRDILLVYSPKPSELSFIANGSNPTSVGLAPGETICFSSLKFTPTSPKEGDSGALFVGMVHNGSPSLHTALEDSFDESDTSSGEGEASDPPALEGATW